MLDQAVSEMKEDLVKMRQASAEVFSTQKMLDTKYKQAQATAVSTAPHCVVLPWILQIPVAASRYTDVLSALCVMYCCCAV